ncbi:HNH endonuclease [Glycomyces sp. TRM65418]|uniref:HNH endonuclease signature motif containing protein n=1 Tax=Glycomyces sp. TRM65418 TaxID=2867006 RepID=UPI001CE5329A|nr:HNH endonuclease signature motif containing protein [Glycomyces sp. TRM65418]MCC3763710.1 HNH endonuclease [Glycomyces sp. TRM65418]QZD57688.1 HNH endonuclease [Glycomyces sp. TRM65418]
MKANETDREAQAAALPSQIESIAAQARAHDARALQAVVAYTSEGLHKECDGFSGIRDWIMECFDFNAATAGQMASIARLAPKFKHLASAALSGTARIDAVAYAVRRLEREGLAVHARIPYPVPAESPYDPSVSCATPEALIREYCVHATRGELTEHLDRLCAELFDRQSLLDELSQQSLAWLEINRRPDGMWDIEGLLTDDTGKLLSNALRTAVPPPRQDEADSDGLLPRVSGRNAEALHQMVAAYGTDPGAPKRHGHTATLNLTCDLATLRGERTGRLPMLDGRAISVSKARLLAWEAGVIPSVFDYSTGEAVELGRAKRLPNVALRHKLELEQPEGCAWSGCRAPVSWTEAHHLEHWADGGATTAENLILLCRFHHSRIHLGRWTIEKTGPGKAEIRHKRTGATDAEWDADPLKDLPNGHSADEWSPVYEPQLTDYANWFAQKSMAATIAESRAKFRESDAAAVKACRMTEPALGAKPVATPATPVVLREDPGGPPFLPRLQRATAEGSAGRPPRSPNPPEGSGPSACPGPEERPGSPPHSLA